MVDKKKLSSSNSFEDDLARIERELQSTLGTDTPTDDKRKVGTKVKDTFSTTVKNMSLKDVAKSLFKSALPADYITATDTLASTKDDISSLYDRSKFKIQSELLQQKRAFTLLAPSVEKALGVNAANKYKGFFNKSDNNYGQSNTPSDDESIANILSSVFKYQDTQKVSDDIKSETNRIYDNKRNEIRYNKQMDVFGQLNTSTTSLLNYHEQIDYSFKKKLLDVQLRGLIESKKTNQLLLAGFEQINRYQQSIVKNTSLPDVVKMQLNEQAGQLLRQGLLSKMQERSIDRLGGVLSGFTNNLIDDVLYKITSVTDLAEQASDGASELRNNGAARGALLGKAAGAGIGNIAGWGVNKLFNTRSNQASKTGLGKVSYSARNIGNIAANKIRYSNNRFISGLADYLPNEKQDLRLRGSSFNQLDNPAVYNGKDQKSLTETIPGLLSRILQSTEGIRTGKVGDITTFDYKTNSFKSINAIGKDVLSTLKDSTSNRFMSNEVDSLIKDLLGDKKLSDGALGVLRREIYGNLIDGRSFDPSRLAYPEIYDEAKSIPDSIKEEIKTTLKDYASFDPSKKSFWKSDNFKNINELDTKYRSAMSSYNNPISLLRQYDNAGQRDALSGINLIGHDGNINREELIKLLAGVDDGRARTTSVQGSFKFSNGRHVFDNAGNTTSDNSRVASDSSLSTLPEEVNTQNIKELVRDVYVSGKSIPVILASQINNQEVINSNDGSLITCVGDIKGPVVDNKGNILITTIDIRKGLYCKSGNKRIYLTGLNVLVDVGIGNITKKAALVKEQISEMGGSLAKQFKHVHDIYVIGSSNPAIKASGIINQEYIDVNTNKPINSYKDITGSVINKEGNVVLTLEDFNKGLYLIINGDVVYPDTSSLLNKTKQTYDKTLTTILNNEAVLGLIDPIVDIYTAGSTEPKLRASLVREGKYRDKLTGLIIKNWNEIKGDVIDENNNVVLTNADIQQGLYSYKNGILTRLTISISETVRDVINMNVGKLASDLQKHIIDKYSKVDVYVRGKKEPILRKVGFEQGDYFDKATGKVLTSIADITGEVVDKDGNVLLGAKEFDAGLVDKDGFTLTKYVASLAKVKSKLVSGALKTAYHLSGLSTAKKILVGNKASRAFGRGIRGAAMLPFNLLFGFGRFNVKAVDTSLPDDASTESVLLNRILYTLRYKDEVKDKDSTTKTKVTMSGALSGLAEKMEKYKLERFNKQRKDDKNKDEESRVNSWRWKSIQAKPGDSEKTKTSKLKKQFPWTSVILGGLMSLGALLLKGMSSLFKTFSGGIISGISKLAKGALSGAGNLAMKGASLLGRGTVTAASWIGRTALPFLLANPIGLAITGVAVAGLTAYAVYKYWKGQPSPLQRYRYAQYGVDLKNEDLMENIAAAENYFYSCLRLGDKDKPSTIDESKFDIKTFANLCGCELGDQNDAQTNNWLGWFHRRFKEVALKWSTIGVMKYGMMKFIDADDLLSDRQKLPFAIDVRMDGLDPNSPCFIYGGPSPFLPTVTGIGIIEEEFINIYNKYYRSMDKTEKGNVNIKDLVNTEVKVDPSRVASFNETVNAGQTGKTTANNQYKTTTATGGDVDGAKGARFNTDSQLVSEEDSGYNVVSGGNFNLIGDDSYYNAAGLENPRNASILTLYRYVCYGMPFQYINDTTVIGKVMQFERDLLKLCKSEMINGRYVLTTGNIALLGNGGKGERIINNNWTTFEKFLAGTIGGQGLGFDASDNKNTLVDVYWFYARTLSVMGKFIAQLNKHYQGTQLLNAWRLNGNDLYDNFLDVANAQMFLDGRPDGETTQRMASATVAKRQVYKNKFEVVNQTIWLVEGKILPDVPLERDKALALQLLNRLKSGDVTLSGKSIDKVLTDDTLAEHFGLNRAKTYQIKDIDSGDIKPTTTGANSMFLGPVNSTIPTNEGTNQLKTLLPSVFDNMTTGPNGITPVDSKDSNLAVGHEVSEDGTAMPSDASTVTSLYGFRKLNGKAARMHNGIDLRAKMGDPVYAYKDGVVTQGWEGNYGTVVLTHQNGLVTRYLHNSKSLVTKGQKVKAGEQIALAGGRGPNGVNEYDPHIHFETMSNGKHVNPLEYLLASKFNLTLDDKRSSVSPLTVAKTWDGKTSHDLTGSPDLSSGESTPINIAQADMTDNTPLPITATKTIGPTISEAGGPDLDKRQNEINEYRQALKRKEYMENVTLPLERSSRILEESYKVQVTMSKLLEEIRDKVSLNPMSTVNSPSQTTTNIPSGGGNSNPIEKIAMAKPIVALSKR